MRCPNDHLRDRVRDKHMYWSWIRVDGAAVIYEQDTLKIHGFLSLTVSPSCKNTIHHTCRLQREKCEEKLLLSEGKERGRAAKWQVKRWVGAKKRRAASYPSQNTWWWVILEEQDKHLYPAERACQCTSPSWSTLQNVSVLKHYHFPYLLYLSSVKTWIWQHGLS